MLFNDFQSIADLKALVGRPVWRLTCGDDPKVEEGTISWFSLRFGLTGDPTYCVNVQTDPSSFMSTAWPVEECYLNEGFLHSGLTERRDKINQLLSTVTVQP